MNYSDSFHNKYLHNLSQDALYFQNIDHELEKSAESGQAVAAKKFQDIFTRTNKVVEHLDQMTQCVSVLDLEEDFATLDKAIYTLNDIHFAVQSVRFALQKIAANEEDPHRAEAALNLKIINTYFDTAYERAIMTSHQRMLKALDFKAKPLLLPKEADLMESVTAAEADLTLSKTALAVKQVQTNYLPVLYSWNLIYTPGVYYNPIPMPVSSYYESLEVNNAERVKDIISMLRGERMETYAAKIHTDEGDVIDKFGESVDVPSVFAADLARMGPFVLNGTVYSRTQENLNECARHIYRVFGIQGGARVMQVCHQGLLVFPLKNKVLPLCGMLPGEISDKWAKKLPGKMILPSNASGMQFEVYGSEKEGKAVMAMKILMKLHTTEETEFTAHFVIKTYVEIPFQELTKEEWDPQQVQVTEMISTLVINNLAEAQELLAKF